MSKTMFRQGDVLLLQEATRPPRLVQRMAATADLILAYGERTGHSHRVSAQDSTLCESEGDESGQAWLEVLRETNLRHEEHSPIVLPVGVYRVILQRRYDPSSDLPAND